MRSSRDYWPWSNGTLPLNFLKIVDQLSSNEVSMQAVCKLTMICEINSMYHCHERPQTMQVRICHLYAVKTHWGVSHLRGLRGLKQEGTEDVKTSDLNFYFKIQSPSMDQAFFTSFPMEIARQILQGCKVPLVCLQLWSLHHLVGELATLPGRCAGLGPGGLES